MINATERKKEETINTPHISREERKEYCSPKYSITIKDLAEGYKHKYHTYYYIVEKSTKRFICKVKDKEQGQKLLERCKCTGLWKVESYTEHEQLLSERMTKNREQRMYVHKPLDTRQKHRAKEIRYQLNDQRRMDKILQTAEQEKFEKGIKDKIKKGAGIGEMTYEKREVVQKLEIEDERRKMLKKFMG